ncbi:MAG TPA: hypothetical protein VGU02_06335 [Gaiellaceae bacterium]|nr:hypothetical protein [Gaiellaceae bacterium]
MDDDLPREFSAAVDEMLAHGWTPLQVRLWLDSRDVNDPQTVGLIASDDSA